MTHGDIISTIDGALTDWETSADAMRWTADEAVLAAAPSDEELTAEQIDQIVAAFKAMTPVLAKWVEDMRAGMIRMAAQLSAMSPRPTTQEWKP